MHRAGGSSTPVRLTAPPVPAGWRQSTRELIRIRRLAAERAERAVATNFGRWLRAAVNGKREAAHLKLEAQLETAASDAAAGAARRAAAAVAVCTTDAVSEQEGSEEHVDRSRRLAVEPPPPAGQRGAGTEVVHAMMAANEGGRRSIVAMKAAAEQRGRAAFFVHLQRQKEKQQQQRQKEKQQQQQQQQIGPVAAGRRRSLSTRTAPAVLTEVRPMKPLQRHQRDWTAPAATEQRPHANGARMQIRPSVRGVCMRPGCVLLLPSMPHGCGLHVLHACPVCSAL